MTFICVDVESDGPYPDSSTGFSMVCFGAVAVQPGLKNTFYGRTAPISANYNPEALAISGFTREQHEEFPPPSRTMQDFAWWLEGIDTPIFVSDNNGYDWMFMCYYLHRCANRNPFGFSSANLNSLYKGLTRKYQASFKHLRRTKHDHHPVNDAKGNAEALIKMIIRESVDINSRVLGADPKTLNLTWLDQEAASV